MPTRLVLRGVLHSFLQTYTSRYSDYRGYWLWGQLVGGLGELALDLLADPDPAPTRLGRLTGGRCRRSRSKSGGPASSRVAEASVRVARLPEPAEGVVNGLRRTGFQIRFEVRVAADTGRRFEASRTVFAAPHYCNGEYRSTRHAAPGTSSES